MEEESWILKELNKTILWPEDKTNSVILVRHLGSWGFGEGQKSYTVWISGLEAKRGRRWDLNPGPLTNLGEISQSKNSATELRRHTFLV